MSVPTATCTVSGMPSRCAATARLRAACGGLLPPRIFAHRLPEALAGCRAAADHLVQDASCLLGHAEPPGPERLVDVLGRRAGQRDFEVVNDAGAVHRQRRHVAALHQIDQHRRDAGLDDMRADAPDDAGARAPARRRSHRRRDGCRARQELPAATSNQVLKVAPGRTGRAKSSARALLDATPADRCWTPDRSNSS